MENLDYWGFKMALGGESFGIWAEPEMVENINYCQFGTKSF
jgi:hypothetical protein